MKSLGKVLKENLFRQNKNNFVWGLPLTPPPRYFLGNRLRALKHAKGIVSFISSYALAVADPGSSRREIDSEKITLFYLMYLSLSYCNCSVTEEIWAPRSEIKGFKIFKSTYC